MAYTPPEPIRGKHDCEGFDCGEESLTKWLHRYARHAEADGSARVFVTTDGKRVVGYYALAAASVFPVDATERLLKGQPKERPVPVVLLARLAVDQEHQGKGVGQSLLRDALLRVVVAAESIGVRALLVHALNDRARDWYMRFGFEDSPTDPLHLILLMKDLKAMLDSVEE